MKIRVLVEQRADAKLDRHHLAAGEVADVPADWAKDLLNRGAAEPVVEKRAAKAEKRVVDPKEKR